MAHLVSVKISAVFDDGNGRLIPSDLPCMLVPACTICTAPTMEANCETCGLPYCSRCLPCSNCVKTPSETPRTIVESCSISGDSGSTEELVVTILPNVYERLRTTNEDLTLEDGVLVRCTLSLGECKIEDEVVSRLFGTSVEHITGFKCVGVF